MLLKLAMKMMMTECSEVCAEKVGSLCPQTARPQDDYHHHDDWHRPHCFPRREKHFRSVMSFACSCSFG